MLKIYLSNLGKYNEGDLVGEWVTLPIGKKELEEVKERIGINEQYEEFFISDYESDIDGLEKITLILRRMDEIWQQMGRLFSPTTGNAFMFLIKAKHTTKEHQGG